MTIRRGLVRIEMASGNRPLAKSATTSWANSMTSTEHQKYAVQRAKILFGSYRRSEAADPETYVLAISAVLACYETEVVRQVTDPTSGICKHEKFRGFLPNAGELAVYCDQVASRAARLRECAELSRPDFSRMALPAPEPRPGRRANVIVRRECPGYPALAERARGADADPAEYEWLSDGIKVSLSWLERARK